MWSHAIALRIPPNQVVTSVWSLCTRLKTATYKLIVSKLLNITQREKVYTHEYVESVIFFTYFSLLRLTSTSLLPSSATRSKNDITLERIPHVLCIVYGVLRPKPDN